MKIEVNECGEIVMTPRALASFAKKKARLAPAEYSLGAEPFGDRDIFSSYTYKALKGGEVFVISGEPDGVFTYGKKLTVQMTRNVGKITQTSAPHTDPVHLAESYVMAYIVMREKNFDRVLLKITLRSKDSERHFDIPLEAGALARAVDGLLERAVFFATVEKNFYIRGKQELSNMPFPYPSIRDGQVDFIKDAYKAMRRGGRLIVSAPTGIGKTVSALFPALKAVGDGIAEKVFYLTAKTVTGVAAARACEIIRKSAPELRAIMLTSKERICPSNDQKIDFHVDECRYDCPRLSDNEGGDYNSRRDRALKKLLGDGFIYDKQAICAAAEEFSVCPHELSLDLSEYCTVIICDYNYAVDPSVKLKRYFVEGEAKYIFLVDEAHNLPDRTREAFSASFCREDLMRLRNATEGVPSSAELASSCDAVIEALDMIAGECLKNSEIRSGESAGYVIDSTVPQKLLSSLEKFVYATSSKKTEGLPDELLTGAAALRSDAYDFIQSAGYFDEHFTFFASLEKGRLIAKIMCLDPSGIIDGVLSGAVSSVLFSATLTPLDYFADVLGCASCRTLELDSPYDPENVCVAAIDTVSTKFAYRKDTSDVIADAILAAITAKSGHYIVYFPSYKYMTTVFNAFSVIAPKGVSAVVQKQGMSIEARNKFLSFFENEDEDSTLVGFCVLGGVFSEGIDLPDKRLIGAILVGIGLPSLSSELNILTEYYDKTRSDGYNFAYLYPAMIKIAQAAGRVIRSENDRGVIVLIDDRYKDPSIIKLLPSHFRSLHYVGDSKSLSHHLKRFWEKNN